MSFHIARFGRHLCLRWMDGHAVLLLHRRHGTVAILYAAALWALAEGSSTPVINNTIINRAFTSISNAS